MNQIFYQDKCDCKETFLLASKKPKKRREGKPASYPTFLDMKDKTESPEIKAKTFQILYGRELSLQTKLLLNSFQKKYIYYAIDDILYKLNFNLKERDELLALLYAPILSLHNSNSVDFFDIWIHEIYIDKITRPNRFLNEEAHRAHQITLTLIYKTKKPTSPKIPLW